MSNRLFLIRKVVAFSCLFPGWVCVQASDGEGSPHFLLNEFPVYGHSRAGDSSRLIGAVDVAGHAQLEYENVDYTLELLGKMPGLYLSDFNQGVITADIAMRGFNAEGSQPHTLLVVDDVPHNLNNGYNDLGSIFPLEIERVEVVKGTHDPRYGLGALAGNLNVYTHRGDVKKLQVRIGSFDTKEVQGLYGLESGGFTQNYFAGYRSSAGYRDHSEIEKYSLSGKWFYSGKTDRWRVGMIARTHEFDGDAPGYLNEELARTAPRTSPAYSSTDGGTIQNRHLSLHASGELSDSLDLSTVAYRHEVERVRFVQFTEASTQQERFEDESGTGAVTAIRWVPQAARIPLRMEFGFSGSRQRAVNQRYASIERQRQSSTRDHLYKLDNGGAYLNTEWTTAPRLRLNLGLRADRFDGEFVDRSTGNRTPILDFDTIWQPKVGLFWELAGETRLFANYGRSFQIGQGSAPYGFQEDLNYSKNDGWEVGIHNTFWRGLTARIALWRQTATDEFHAKPDMSGDIENIGETRRQGADLEVSWRPHGRLNLWVSYTLQEAILVDPGHANAVVAGNKLDHVPDFLFKAGLDVTLTDAWEVAAYYIRQGDYYLTTANDGGRFGRISAANIDLRYILKNKTFGLHVKNLFDTDNEYVWFDGSENLHSPGDPRSFNGSITIHF